MIIQSNRWIRNGFAIGVESVKLLFRNPVLFVYTLVPALVSAFFFLRIDLFIKQNLVPAEFENYGAAAKATYGLWALIALSLGTFFACCLARHAMHILRQQPITVRTSCMWVFTHYRHIVAWILVQVVLSLSWRYVLPPLTYVVLLIGGIIASLYFVGFLATVLLFLGLHIVVPIIANEPIEVIPAIKRSTQVVWNYLGTYIVTMFTSSILAALLYILPGIIIALFVVSRPDVIWHSLFFSMLVMPITTIAFTIFYHEFYVKREVESVEQLFNQPL